MVPDRLGATEWSDWPVAGRRGAAWFEYVGRTALVLTGPFTGQTYRFAHPGAVVPVDARDRYALLAVPVLRMILD